MIEPGRFASISRSATACAMKNAARTLSPMMTSKSSTVTSASIFGRLVPALLTSTSNGSARATAARAAAMSVTSRGSASALVAARANCVRRRLDLALCARRQRHMRAGLRQCGCCREPDAAPAAGDQRALAVEAERGRFREVDFSGETHFSVGLIFGWAHCAPHTRSAPSPHAKRGGEGWGGGCCCDSALDHPPTPDPSPPLANARGGRGAQQCASSNGIAAAIA